MQFTFDIPDDQVDRVKAWVRTRFPAADEIDGETGLPYGEPTNAELIADFKFQIRRWVKEQVQQYELLEQHKTIFQSYTQIDMEDV